MTVNEITAELTFADLNLRPELQETLTKLGYEEPTPIQSQSIPYLLEGKDLLGQAATGTGKTAAFALPLLHNLQTDSQSNKPQALVLVPTRELAMQVSEAIHRYGKSLNVHVVPVYGGQPIGRQLDLLKKGVDVVVATPGRAVDLIKRNALRLEELNTVVLDEADEMLDMGFADDLDAILDATPGNRQTVLFSATLPSRINSIARKYMKDPIQIDIKKPKADGDKAPLVRQSAYIVARAHKSAAIGRIIDVEVPSATIVFCRTREQVDTLTDSMNGRGYRAEALHGGLNQLQRDQVLGRLRKQTADLLIATDVAARGLDIDHLTHVINYDVPSSPEIYVHRIGRVGRAGREGAAITLAEPREHRTLKTIERVAKVKIEMASLPTIADVQSRRLEKTQETLRETLVTGDFDEVRAVIESLSDEFDIVEVALAAVKLLHDASGPQDQVEIPEQVIDLRDNKRGRNDSRERGGRDNYRGKENFRDRGDRNDRGDRSDRNERGPRGKSGGRPTKLHLNIGRNAGVRPQDIVGAIAGETSLSGRDVGDIKISADFTIVEVPATASNEVITALRNTTVKGKKVTARPDRPRF